MGGPGGRLTVQGDFLADRGGWGATKGSSLWQPLTQFSQGPAQPPPTACSQEEPSDWSCRRLLGKVLRAGGREPGVLLCPPGLPQDPSCPLGSLCPSLLSQVALGSMPRGHSAGEVSPHLFRAGSGGCQFKCSHTCCPSHLGPKLQGSGQRQGTEGGESPVPLELLGTSDSVSTHQERKGNGAPAYYTTFILQVEK